ncbi:endonuclease/exonuclease/phosphatase family protein [Pelagicoccus mobilis]|uniref:Endonuclease/exonuclease/phosphatase family protein n=1 Tax=Pelagicoccus mobilis TaxID=415221 RepID=A0A934VLG3_9BACT|nr:endonuclease/exonuclease/phosphatase family protein [Pelagicoccus mobilis]MBK1877716.1 endonuclease/exonuclease/phosphatase family protein [Pelagicoccus mobilis]
MFLRPIIALSVALFGLLAVTLGQGGADAGKLRVATYNLRNYLSMDRQVDGVFRRDYPKPEEEKAILSEVILSVSPDVLVVQEIGGPQYLEELRSDLELKGLEYEESYVLEADDDVRKIGALWKADVEVEAIAHTADRFNLFGTTHSIKRGLLELRVGAEGMEDLSIFALHLKSKYTTDQRDPQALQQRTKEAQAARDRILKIYPRPDASRFLILGDLNDYRNSSPVRRFLVKGDLRISQIQEFTDADGLIWTHYYKKGGEYSLIDYILASPGLSEGRDIVGGVQDSREYYKGSDHRLVWADIPFQGN